MIRPLLALAVAASLAPRDPLQAACEQLVGKRAIAVVALEPGTGRLRALVHPALAAEPHPPGSTFKLVTSLAAIEAHLAPAGRGFHCTGAYKPHGKVAVLPCYKADGHGHIALEEALAQSCNVTFFALSERLGPARLRATAERCGLTAKPCWLNIPRDPRAALQLGIGDCSAIGLNAERLAALAGAIASGGPVLQPSWTPAPPAGPPLADAATLKRLRAGMRAAVVHGSAQAATVKGLAVAGKTGTSTYLDGSNRTHGWFIGYAPADGATPKLAIAVFVKRGTGFGHASKLGGQVFAAWKAQGLR